MPCTPRLCPYATWVNGVGVNRAAYSGYTAGLMMLNINAASTYQAAAYSLSSLFTLPTYSTPVRPLGDGADLRSFWLRKVSAAARVVQGGPQRRVMPAGRADPKRQRTALHVHPQNVIASGWIGPFR